MTQRIFDVENKQDRASIRRRIMTNCKNCKMTDEYCASGDCSNDTLIEQWKKGELLYAENARLKYNVGNLGYKIKNQRHEINNRLKEIEKLKELLKECREVIEWQTDNYDEKPLVSKIDEVLE